MLKAIDKWLIGYLRSVLARPQEGEGPRHLLFCLCDHFEPFRDGVGVDAARETVARWLEAYPAMAVGFRDADGKPPRHTFFYPHEEYDPVIIDQLAAFARQGYGEVEIHLHHRHDTAAGLKEKLTSFRDLLHTRHGLLGVHRSTNPSHPRFAFIHGNWSLCNSRPDGDWCGVNEELGVLAEAGCYADLTFPSAPSPTQPRQVNSLYYARDTPGRPRGADRGVAVRSGQLPPTGDPSPLMLITGPLALNWRRRKWGLLPRLENAEISGVNPPTEDRLRLWARQQIHVAGRPEWVFVKLHTHGCVPANAKVLLGDAMRRAHELLHRDFNDGTRWQLHYVTARELYNLAKAAEANLPGPPASHRDHPILWPCSSSPLKGEGESLT